MKYIALPALAASLLATSAIAADLPRRNAAIAPAPVYSVPVFTWTGFYIGGQAGYVWGSDKIREVTTATGLPTGINRNLSPSGVAGGLHAGYNYQINQLVLGVEGDIEATSVKRRVVGYPVVATASVNTKEQWQGSLRARVGYAFDRAMIYGTGGVAFADWKHTYTDNAVPFARTFSNTRTGWTLGAGLEYAITNNWTARAEYRYTDFGRSTNVLPAALAGTFTGMSYRHRENDSAVRIGVSYLFNTGPSGSVVAKY